MPRHNAAKRTAVLYDYRLKKMTVENIAEKHGVSLPTIGAWVTAAKIPFRGRGRRKKTEPDEMDKRIIALASICTYESVAARFKTTKQNIGRIVKRWRNWEKTTGPSKELPPPFGPGDLLMWKDQKVCVVCADMDTGVVRDKNGRLIRSFPWVVNAKLTAEKIGHDPTFGRKPRHNGKH